MLHLLYAVGNDINAIPSRLSIKKKKPYLDIPLREEKDRSGVRLNSPPNRLETLEQRQRNQRKKNNQPAPPPPPSPAKKSPVKSKSDTEDRRRRGHQRPKDSDSTTSPVRRERRRRPPLLGGRNGGTSLKSASEDISYLSDVTKGRSRERIAIIEDGVST